MLTWFFIGFVSGAGGPLFLAWLVVQRNKHLRERLRYWINKEDDSA